MKIADSQIKVFNGWYGWVNMIKNETWQIVLPLILLSKNGNKNAFRWPTTTCLLE